MEGVGEGEGEECKQNSHVLLVMLHDLVLNVSGLWRVWVRVRVRNVNRTHMCSLWCSMILYSMSLVC